ncbi:hypothetical protein HIJ77_003317 [Salmonella enterica]|nr:hypothetical protein [Salmonella enterica]EDV2947378.1 hypothetical protein [Salmonella enterica subsp. houtenae]EGY1152358.1 hypothetical protein [Salmonella enterica subsp. enterica]EAV2689591.1 hypothetical protein [Salmonella enterica]EAV5573482.1 hypothetical protein [Salmonella enterica]
MAKRSVKSPDAAPFSPAGEESVTPAPPVTRKWTEAIYQQYPQVRGLSWISRQDDSARAVVLSGDRIAQSAPLSHDLSRGLLEDGDAYDAVHDLAERIGVSVIPGKS